MQAIPRREEGDPFVIYYAETNLIAIIVAAVLLSLSRRISSRNETSQIIMKYMLSLLILLSVCDIFAYYFRGKSYIGVQISNILYFIAMALGSFTWFLYILVKTGRIKNIWKTLLFTGAPAILLCAAIALNPVTNFFFSVDEELLYHRGSGVALTWVIEWGYILVALVFNVRSVLTEKRAYRKKEYQGYLVFMVPMALAAICQMLFYGTTTTQVGFMIALLLAYLNMQYYQVQRDELTGLNNKNAFLSYQDSLFTKSPDARVTVFMMDSDNFKSINDLYGHLKGDQALRDMADVLKAAMSSVSQNRAILFRYGGDEFIVVGKGMTDEHIQQLCQSIETHIGQMNERNNAAGEKYTLSISVGTASMVCKNMEDFNELMKLADEAMYQAKRAKKAAGR